MWDIPCLPLKIFTLYNLWTINAWGKLSSHWQKRKGMCGMYVSEWMRKCVTVWWKLDVRSGSVGMYVWFICLCGCVYVCPDGWVKVRSRSWTIMRRSEDAVGPCSRGGCRGNATGTSIYGRFRGVSSGFFFPHGGADRPRPRTRYNIKWESMSMLSWR